VVHQDVLKQADVFDEEQRQGRVTAVAILPQQQAQRAAFQVERR